jgi:phenylpropionate dioxygenase-like ring-hydroxylating dioxygenase large terminal subunit
LRAETFSAASTSAILAKVMTDASTASSANSSINDGLMRGFWYPALRSNRVRGRELRTAMLLGLPLVIGRNAKGEGFALRDACPHRGMPLSEGKFDGHAVECPYHGWVFEGKTGQCQAIPSLTARDKLKVERVFATSFKCEEGDGYFWVFVPDPERRNEEAPEAPRLPTFSADYRIEHLEAELPCHVDHGIIGLMDPAHGPFVHQSWWWRKRSSIHEKEKTFEPIPNGFRIMSHSPSTNSAAYKLLGVYGEPVTTTIEFVLPNMRFEEIHCGKYWFSSRTTVTPITAARCRIDVCAAWNAFRHVPFFTSILRFFGKRFVEQDRQTMVKQSEGLKYNPPLMLIDDADRPAKWYFALKAAYLKAKDTGQPMEHPIEGPTVLKWRS